MDQAIAKARTLIEALSYIQRFRGKIVVIKVGGSVMDSPDAMKDLLIDVVFMNTVGMKPVLVHGGGKAISMDEVRNGNTLTDNAGDKWEVMRGDRKGAFLKNKKDKTQVYSTWNDIKKRMASDGVKKKKKAKKGGKLNGEAPEFIKKMLAKINSYTGRKSLKADKLDLIARAKNAGLGGKQLEVVTKHLEKRIAALKK